VKNEDYIRNLISVLHQHSVKYSIFNEPDIDNQVTAIAIEPSEQCRKICKNLPLALKEFSKGKLLDKNNFKT